MSIKKDRNTLHNLNQIIFLKEKRDLAFLNSGTKEGNRTKSGSTSSSSSKKKAYSKKSGDSSSMGNSNSKSKVGSNKGIDEVLIKAFSPKNKKVYTLKIKIPSIEIDIREENISKTKIEKSKEDRGFNFSYILTILSYIGYLY